MYTKNGRPCKKNGIHKVQKLETVVLRMIYIKRNKMFQRLQPPVVELSVLQGSENWSHPISFHRSRKANNNSLKYCYPISVTQLSKMEETLISFTIVLICQNMSCHNLVRSLDLVVITTFLDIYKQAKKHTRHRPTTAYRN